MSSHKKDAFKKDALYQQALNQIVDFRFDEKTVDVFPDMINRSVPGYSTMISVTGIVASEYIRPGGRVYDLGCSLGASTMSLVRHRRHNDFEIIALDNSAAMIDKCRQLTAVDSSAANPEQQSSKPQDTPYIDWQCADILETSLKDCDVVIMNLLLQFLPPQTREQIIGKIFQALNPGGVLLMAEKIHFADVLTQQNMDSWQRYFKKQNGYSELEITQKRKAIEKTMQPDTEETHRQRLQSAGFINVTPLYQALNFKSWIAAKPAD